VTASRTACVLFDIGKVLIDFDFQRFGKRMSELTALGADFLGDAITAGDLPARYESGRLSDAEFHQEVCRRIGRQIPWNEFVAAWNSIFLATPILREEVLLSLARKRDLWVISNTNRIHFDFILERYSALRYFKGFILSHEVGVLKPDPDIFRYALSKAGCEAGEALFVDDIKSNVEAACRLGMDAIHFVDSKQLDEELRRRHLLE
jgi:glucose-1-phosphatase